ncbi:MAG: hypothetical protein SynsKO_18620 [Synoicihabitans sp.]
MPTETPTLRDAWQVGLRGARANLVPGLVLQVFALALVLGYYFAPGIAESLEHLARFRERVGISYSIVSTALFGGLIPWLYIKANPATRNRYSLAQGLGLIAFWGYKGVEMHALYGGMAALFGHDNSFTTVATKVVVDQLVYCPLLAVPGMWLAYKWVEGHFAIAPIARSIRTKGFVMREIVPVLVANFGVWAPTVTIIYTLPTVLQLPLENLVLCFFTLMLAHMSRADEGVR